MRDNNHRDECEMMYPTFNQIHDFEKCRKPAVAEAKLRISSNPKYRRICDVHKSQLEDHGGYSIRLLGQGKR